MGIKAEAAKAQWQAHVTQGDDQQVGKGLLTLRRQLEWYLSDANLSTDKELHHKISMALPEGWLCCSELLDKKPIRELGATLRDIVKSLHNSHLETKLTVPIDNFQDADAEELNQAVFVRRRQPLPPLLSLDKQTANGEVVVDPKQLVLVDRHQTMNRLRDQWRVKRQLQLAEVGDSETVFHELLRPRRGPQMSRQVIAIGYERVVYGDHGPYIEFSKDQIRWSAWPHYFDKRKYRSYFDEYYTEASHQLWKSKWDNWDPNPSKGVLMLYAQTRSVNDRPWAPGSGSTPHAGRPNGYADYRPGYYYVAAEDTLITTTR
mmetsp:Transcript_145329/g.253627  ORF Transcript_145329/g.253627 Transcript_145329/m.253627 type:complete len:318 (+) Transcript_145329:151-1104(+)